jgi:cytochrome c oxidase subunit 2
VPDGDATRAANLPGTIPADAAVRGAGGSHRQSAGSSNQKNMANILLIVLAAALPSAASAQPSGEDAARIAEIGWVLYVGAAAIFVAVGVLLALALFGSAPASPFPWWS